jgi:hypothetical protein
MNPWASLVGDRNPLEVIARTAERLEDLARISHHGKEIGKRVDGKRFLEASRTGRGFFRT